MKLREVGEREVIKRVIKRFPQMVEVGIGDDCAAIDIGGQLLLVTTDMISEKTHIPPGATGFQVGWFVSAINLSDIAAKGGRPLGLTMAMGLPRSLDLGFAEEVAKGANACAEQYGITIIGGDTKEVDFATFTGTALGLVAKGQFMPRKGAGVGDMVCLTGSLGGAGAGVYAVKNELGRRSEALREILEVYPRVNEGIALAATGYVTSSMDISDGLASSLYQLMEVNPVGFRIFWDMIPQSPYAIKIGKKDMALRKNFALYSGGDYELLCTVKKEMVSLLQKRVASVNGSVFTIGEVIKDRGVVVAEGEVDTVVENRGFEHFL